MLSTELSYDPAISLLGIQPREMKTCSPKNFCKNVDNNFIQNKQKVEIAQMLSTHEWVNKIWFNYIMENYSEITHIG